MTPNKSIKTGRRKLVGSPSKSIIVPLRYAPNKDGPGSINTSISIGGMVVNPGDVILGDCDGIIALSPSIALEAAKLGKEKETAERKTIQSILDCQYNDAWVDATLKQKGAL